MHATSGAGGHPRGPRGVGAALVDAAVVVGDAVLVAADQQHQLGVLGQGQRPRAVTHAVGGGALAEAPAPMRVAVTLVEVLGAGAVTPLGDQVTHLPTRRTGGRRDQLVQLAQTRRLGHAGGLCGLARDGLADRPGGQGRLGGRQRPQPPRGPHEPERLSLRTTQTGASSSAVDR